MQELTIKNLKNNYEFYLSIISTFIVGIFCHGMVLFNKYSIHDDIFAHDLRYTITSGRFGLKLISVIEMRLLNDFQYSLPVFNGIISLLILSMVSYFIIKSLKIKDLFSIVIINSLIVSFPTVTATFGYMFTAHYYFSGLMLGTFGVYLIDLFTTTNNKLYLIPGLFLITSSFSIYQAYIPFIISLFVIILINYVIHGKNCDFKLLIKKSIIFITSLVLSFALYILILKLLMFRGNYTLNNYKGINAMGYNGIGAYFSRLLYSYKEFVLPNNLRSTFMYPNNLHYLYILIVLLVFIYLLWKVKYLLSNRNNCSFILLLLIIVLPLSINFIYIMVDNSEVHSLMVYAQVYIYILFVLILLDVKALVGNNMIIKYSCYLFMILLSYIVLIYGRFNNKCYVKLNYVQQQALSYFTTLQARIESVKGFDDELPVAFINFDNVSDKYFSGNSYFKDIHIIPYMDVEDVISNNSNNIRFMEQWLGFKPKILNVTNELKEVAADMTHYPDDGSIKVIDQKVIVNF